MRNAAFRFQQISTDEVYGDLLHPDEIASGEVVPLFTETTPYVPSSPYSVSKALAGITAMNKVIGLGMPVDQLTN